MGSVAASVIHGEQAGGGRAEDANSFTGSDQDMCRGRMELQGWRKRGRLHEEGLV